MKKRVAIIGTGDLAVHIAHYLIESEEYEIVGFFDDFKKAGSTLNKYPVIGNTDEIAEAYHSNVFEEIVIAIGYTRMEYRKSVYDKLKGKVRFAGFIHKSCYVDKTAILGEGVIIFPGCIIDKNAEIKSNVFMHVGCVISHDSCIMEHSYLSPGVTTAGFVIIGEQCNIGIRTTISDSVTLCNKVRTGAGTVIIKNIEDQGTYVGVPCRKIKNTM